MRVVIVGAGYAGVMAANYLARRGRDVEVVVVAPRPEFVQRIRLHEYVASGSNPAHPIGDFLSPKVQFVTGTVRDVGRPGLVALDQGDTVAADRVVVAVGSESVGLGAARVFGDWGLAEGLAEQVRALPAGGRMAVIGAGLTGVEAAAEVAQARPDLDVYLLGAQRPGSGLGDRGRRALERRLEALNVTTVLGVVTDVTPDAVHFADGEPLQVDMALWSVVQRAPALLAASGLAVDGVGRGLVDARLRSVSHPHVLLAGDCAAVPGARMACATALPQGHYVARSLVRESRGKSVAAFSMGYAGQVVSLGRGNGVYQATDRADRPRGLAISGRGGGFTKESVCRTVDAAVKRGRWVAVPGPR